MPLSRVNCCARAIFLLFQCVCLLSCASDSQTVTTTKPSSFTVIPLGVRGGLDESNLSSYLIAEGTKQDYLALDAGTLYGGIQAALETGAFASATDPHPSVGDVLRTHIKGYAISHAHLDHLTGLAINATDDVKKPIYALSPTIDVLKEHIFNWQVWPNFADEGASPTLSQYQYVRLKPGNNVPVKDTNLSIRALPLSHNSRYPSSVFIVEDAKRNTLVYLGDTGPDEVENSILLNTLWQQLAPLIREQKLKAIFIEVSYPDPREDGLLFGHLTPVWLETELKALAKAVSADGSLETLAAVPIVITHMKPSFDEDTISKITQQLKTLKRKGVTIVLPQQGRVMHF